MMEQTSRRKARIRMSEGRSGRQQMNEQPTLARTKNMQRGMDVVGTGRAVFPKSQAKEIIETRGMSKWDRVDAGYGHF